MLYLPDRERGQDNNILEQLTYLATVMDNSAQPFISGYSDGYILLCNNHFIEMIGYDQEELFQLKWDDDLTPQEWSIQTQKVTARLNATRQPQRYEKEYIRKDGIRIPVEIIIHIVQSNYNENVYYYAFVTDISARKEAEKALIQSNQQLKIAKVELMAANEQLMATEEELRQQLNELELNKKALSASEARYRNILESMEDAYYEVDLKGNYTFINQYLLKYAELLDGFLGSNYRDVMDNENAKKVRRVFKQVYRSGKPVRDLGWYITKKDGNRIYVESTVQPILEENRITGFRGIVRDLTERRLAQEALQTSEARYRAVVEDQTEMICRFLPDGTLTFVNEAYCQCINKQREEIIGSSFLPQINKEDRIVLETALATINPQNPVAMVEFRIETAGKGSRWHQWTHHGIYDQNGNMTNFQSVGRDISEQKEAQEKLRYLSLHDSLTGLYNRFYFEEEMRRLESQRNNPVAMIMCDVDGLKLINDTLGHSKGDELLIIAANIIKKCFRDGDVVARVGGDEFAVLLPRTPRNMVEQAIGRIGDAIKNYNKDHNELPLSLSIGFSVRNDNNNTINEVFKEADNKMYREKLHSRQSNRSVIVQTLMQALGARDFITEGHGERLQQLVNDMALALDLHNGNINDLRLLAQFHDIGKVGVSDTILFKAGPLEPGEFTEMKRHSEIGHRIALSAPDLVLIADWILKHHEWWNGGGYPLGLKGEEIPLECRILAIADAYDAMTNDRPYRKALPVEAAVKEIQRYAGVQFDPFLVDKFVTILMKPKH